MFLFNCPLFHFCSRCKPGPFMSCVKIIWSYCVAKYLSLWIGSNDSPHHHHSALARYETVVGFWQDSYIKRSSTQHYRNFRLLQHTHWFLFISWKSDSDDRLSGALQDAECQQKAWILLTMPLDQHERVFLNPWACERQCICICLCILCLCIYVCTCTFVPLCLCA